LLHNWKEGHNAAGEYPNKQKRECCFVETEGLGLSYFFYNGLPGDHAEIAAHALVKASLRGVDSHGVARVAMYCERLRRKVTNPRPEITVARVTPAVAQIDGDNGLGLVVGNCGMNEAIAIAKEFGIGLDGFQGTGRFFMALKADAFMPLEQFKERLGTLAARVKAQPPAEGVDQILMPGEPEALTESERSENGIPLTPDVVASLMAESDLADISIDFT
jgi:LDH2 family malate/lactate/ureidoglycolate dehydrogenase